MLNFLFNDELGVLQRFYNNRSMKNLVNVLVFSLGFGVVNAQSKKEMIVLLNSRVDSLNQVVASERSENTRLTTKIGQLEAAIKRLENEKSALDVNLEAQRKLKDAQIKSKQTIFGSSDDDGSRDVFANDTEDDLGRGDGSGNVNGNLKDKWNSKEHEKRKIVIGPDQISSEKDGYVYLQVTINPDGDVIKVVDLKSKTTIKDQNVINQVVSNVKSKMKYNKISGNIIQTQNLKIIIKSM